MSDMTLTPVQREARLEGMGCKRKRVEDVRFTQGKGNAQVRVKTMNGGVGICQR